MKIRENAAVLDFLAVDNFDFTRIWEEVWNVSKIIKSHKSMKLCQKQ